MLDNTSSIICAFGLAAAAPRSPYRHLELCGITLTAYPKIVSCATVNYYNLVTTHTRRAALANSALPHAGTVQVAEPWYPVPAGRRARTHGGGGRNRGAAFACARLSRCTQGQHHKVISTKILGQYHIILSADTASEVRQLLSQKRR